MKNEACETIQRSYDVKCPPICHQPCHVNRLVCVHVAPKRRGKPHE